MIDNKILRNIHKILQNNLEIIIKDTDFATKNCRSAKKIAQLIRQLLKSNDSETFVVEMYIYRTKKCFYCETIQKILFV